MKTILAMGAGVLETCAAILLIMWLNRKKITEIKTSRKTRLIALGVCIISVLFSQVIMRASSGWIEVFLLSIMYVLLLAASVIDWEQRIVPNRLLALGVFLRAGIFGVEALADYKAALPILLVSLKSVVVAFAFLMVIVIVSRRSIGFGDVKLLCVMVLYSGLVGTYNCFFAALLMSGVVSVYLLAVKKTGKKYRIAFVPYLFMGYVLTTIM